jgi:hypothetical protein
MNDLERRITAALDNGHAGSAELAEFITEVEVAAEAAAQTAEQERAKSLDITASFDVSKALEAVGTAELRRDRLNNILVRLRSWLEETMARESRERWLERFQRVEKLRNEAAERFAKVPELIEELLTLFEAAAATDRECSRVNAACPSGERRWLKSVELTARGLTDFSTHQPSLLQVTQLFGWDNSGQKLWPPQTPFDQSALAAVLPAPVLDPRYSADWWKVQQATNTERAKTEEKWADEEGERVAESRRRYENSLLRR